MGLRLFSLSYFRGQASPIILYGNTVVAVNAVNLGTLPHLIDFFISMDLIVAAAHSVLISSFLSVLFSLYTVSFCTIFHAFSYCNSHIQCHVFKTRLYLL